MRIVIALSLLLSFNAAWAQTGPSFSPAPGSPISVGTGSYPGAIVAGDFNKDGVQDFATSNAGSNTVTVFLGSRSGAFTQASGSPMSFGFSLGTMATGDFNGDGGTDIALINYDSQRVIILLGNGTGGFSMAASISMTGAISLSSIAVGDLNRDGKQDLVVADYDQTNNLYVLLGNGSGGFTVAPGSPFPNVTGTTSVALGDFNGDGVPDLVSANDPSMNVSVLLGNGSGGFTMAPGSPFTVATGTVNPISVVVADFNKDGRQDFAVENLSSNNVSVFLGKGSGQFAAAPGSPFPAGAGTLFGACLAAADFNGDGVQDLVTANAGTDDVTVLLGTGTGGFVSASGSPFSLNGRSPIAVAVGDFNGDGIEDIATADTVTSVVTVLLGGGSPAATVPAIKPGGIVPVYSTVTTIQSGEWVSIYGTNLASSTVTWNGDFPTSLGGTIVTINGKKAYLWFVSPTQINLQAPSDTTTGSVPVVVTTANGTVTSTVTLAPFAPSFSLLDAKHVTGIILRSKGTGAYGGGAYDIIGPTGTSLGYPTVAAKAGDTVELFAVGLGPTSPSVPPGQVFASAASTTNSVSLLINNITVIPTFAGLSSAGLYQINLTIPVGLGTGDVPLVATVGGARTPTSVVISLQ